MERWQARYLQVTLRTPLRCGDRPTGFVARTLPFVPAHVPLNALAPVLVRALDLPETWDAYEGMLTFLSDHLRTTPFFVRDADTGRPLIPGAGQETMQKLEARMIGARYGVGINYAHREAMEGRLFEIEAINPSLGAGRQTVLTGYVLWRAGSAEVCGKSLALDGVGGLCGKPLAQWIQACQWGGERNKGYGALAEVTHVSGGPQPMWEAPMDPNHNEPVVAWPAGRPAPVYLAYQPELADVVTGRPMPVVGRIFDRNDGFGQNASRPLLVWNVGWRADRALTLHLQTHMATGQVV